uniref:Katanin p80 wd40 repeat-containing subunit b1 protein n=1 Tax=Tetraselmis sp. GSL018 TaxID=582737 RepID=A0A061R040_9CHLO|mmetsp:Transcript_41594/g.98610  ORF Transcript_41594/g.98610 Transcript_41594/m.98610 type:complete len:137 (-) Transcript_41594:557-967(-)|eukprot:CAMPEP_0177609968 /NCGR_PEP_ID=MMETSP0419_2-20121207/19458_1 /TAXON_ID=582737 /ORGANISM="Tetraselmis sp., Strain GSL018" /LENGTH=136 /DNA_ID=CAMNT_0019105101 /DNA_START=397 /DNA_END=807 /DNA_ORIENTATION=+
MPNVKRSYKLQEFVAHSSNVNCLRIGRKSSGVLVTGGDDKKVNMWAIGKPNAILSLAGHQSPVDCVAFDNSEEVVAAGATSGTVKLWDLEEAKGAVLPFGWDAVLALLQWAVGACGRGDVGSRRGRARPKAHPASR